jgi:predicted TIM-barrel fold metal-dependent hydrolase
MNRLLQYYCAILCILAPVLFQRCSPSGRPAEDGSNPSAQYYTVDDFASVAKVNTHAHLNTDDTLFLHQAKLDNFRLISVNVDASDFIPIREQQEVAVRLCAAYPHELSYATSFEVTEFGTPDWQTKTLAYLNDSFSRGAIAVKVWKNIGMELKDANGVFVQIDDPRFDPILDFIEQHDITVIGHIGEPRNAWLPVTEMTVGGDRKYFSEHPQFHMYLHPEYPRYEQIIAARDHMLEKHPSLRFVGAHLGSLEWSVDELAKRLDRYPNMAVDMAERISHLQYQAVTQWQKVHDFLIRYQDRLIYATDETVDGSKPPAEVALAAHENWLRHWRFFVSGDTMRVPKVEESFRGMRLPREAVDKIYRKNAEKWFPALAKEGA